MFRFIICLGGGKRGKERFLVLEQVERVCLIGIKLNPNEIRERIQGIPCLEESFDRFRNHLFANRIVWNAEDVILGPMLSFDSKTEKFVGDFANEANALITRVYREPFVVPERV